MVLEASMICVVNSEWMRNSDCSPNRFQAQADAVNFICGAKTQYCISDLTRLLGFVSNPENTVGVMTMAGKGVRVLTTPTSYLGKLLGCMHVAAVAAAGGVTGFYFGVYPNLDPELALDLRISMEEGRARQEAAAKRAAEEASGQDKGQEQSSSQDATMAESTTVANIEADTQTSDLMDDENALLQQALAMSMNDSDPSTIVRDTDMSDAAAVDQDLQLAFKLSVQESANESSSQTDMSNLLADQAFMSSILAQLPGVDPNDPAV
ncbi:26S proteasome non-ATPase regulatory subunit 4-like protein [Drosera capensis]